MIQDEIMKLQTYKMFEGDSDIYVERDDVLEVLKQEPCDDCISRQAVIDVTWEEPSYTDALNVLTEVRDKVKVLPPVKPQEQESVIDKIRAEIEQERIGYPPSADYYKAIMKCLQIIDKYKESEDKE